MKTRIQKLLVGVALVAATTLAQAQFTYTNNGNGTCTITGYTGPGGAVTIPNSINGLSVVSILTFDNNISLTGVIIPASVTNIWTYAFYYCDSLAGIAVDVANPFYSSANGVLFDKNQTTLVTFPRGLGGSYTIPDSVTNIGGSAFARCASLTNITIPDSVTAIGDSAFRFCAGLASVAIGNGVTDIGDSAFDGCTGLTNITIPASVISIGGSAFARCTSLTSVTIPVTVTTIGDFAFGLCAGLTNVAIGNGVTDIGNSAFSNCGLISVSIPNSVTNIGYYAFSDCGRVTNVIIPANVTSIGNGAFASCTSLTGISVDGANPFYSSANGVLFDKNQTTLIAYPGGLGGSFTIPATVVSIAESAFYYCTSLTNVIIPNSVTTVGDVAFSGCEGLTSVTIPASVTSIGGSAFDGCYSLAGAYFLGSAPYDPGDVFGDASYYPVVVYYLPGATGWGPYFSSHVTELWNPQAGALRVTGGHFGFDITGPSNTVIVVEACTNLGRPVWLPVSTNVLNSSGASSFSDSGSGNYPARFYRFRSP